jgi:hypothetical protein
MSRPPHPSTNDFDRPKEDTRPDTRGTSTLSLLKTDHATKASAGRGRLSYESLPVLTCTISGVERSIIDLYHITIGRMCLLVAPKYIHTKKHLHMSEANHAVLWTRVILSYAQIEGDVSLSRHTQSGTGCYHQSCSLSIDRTLERL